MPYYVYIVASRTKRLYTGVTNNLERRVWEHRAAQLDGFTKMYNIHRLVHCEEFADIREALEREKQVTSARMPLGALWTWVCAIK